MVARRRLVDLCLPLAPDKSLHSRNQFFIIWSCSCRADIYEAVSVCARLLSTRAVFLSQMFHYKFKTPTHDRGLEPWVDQFLTGLLWWIGWVTLDLGKHVKSQHVGMDTFTKQWLSLSHSTKKRFGVEPRINPYLELQILLTINQKW